MKLQPLLSEYLFLNGNLPLQGVGQLYLRQTSATVVDAILMAPATTITFQQNTSETSSEKLTTFIANRLQISMAQAQAVMQESNLQQVVAEGEEQFSWPTVGTFSQAADGSLIFQPENFLSQYLPTISLISVQQTKQAPAMENVVAEPEPTESFQEEALATEEWDEPIQRSRWWIWAIVIFIVSLLLIVFRFM